MTGPIPSSLAGEPPIPDDTLTTLFDQAAATAADAGVDVADAVDQIAASEDAPRWHITDLGGAEWAMRHVAESDATLTGLVAQADEWTTQVREWLDREAGRVRARRAFFARHLERWAIRQRDESGGRVKSVSLPSGLVRTVERQPRVTVTDDEAVAAWADASLAVEDASMVAPVQRRVCAQPLRQHTRIVEAPTRARIVLDTGELVDWVEAHGAIPVVGACYSTTAARVALVDVLETRLMAVGPDDMPVPGTSVDPGGVTATVQAAQS